MNDKQIERLLASVAHEMRSPLNHIFMMADMIATSEASSVEQTRSDLKDIMDSAIRALAAVDVIKELLDTVTLPPHFTTVDLSRLIRDAVTVLESTGSETIHQVQMHLPPDAVYVHADWNQLARLTAIMLEWAVICAAPRPISIALHAADEVLTVSISSGNVDPTTSDFQAIEIPTEQFKGKMGIKLLTAEKIARLHGGDIWMSASGNGTLCLSLSLLLKLKL